MLGEMYRPDSLARNARTAAEKQKETLERIRDLQSLEQKALEEYETDEAKEKFQEAYRLRKISEIREDFRQKILRESEDGLKASETFLKSYSLPTLLRKAPLLPDGSPEAEAMARSAFLQEATALDDDSFQEEVEEALQEKDLARLHLLRTALAQRPFPTENDRGNALAEFRHLVLPKLELPEVEEAVGEIEDLHRSFETALRSVETGDEDIRLLMAVVTEGEEDAG